MQTIRLKATLPMDRVTHAVLNEKGCCATPVQLA